jgi:hypothetical protein
LTPGPPTNWFSLNASADRQEDFRLSLLPDSRYSQRDRDDVKHLAKTVPLDLEVLKERYRKELHWQLGNPEREDLTLRLWIEAIEEERSR